MEPIYEYVKSQFGLGVLVAVILVAALVYATWLIASQYARFKDKTDNLPCERHGNEIDKNREDMKVMEVSVSKIATRVEDMYEILKMMAGNSQSSRLTQSHSPVSLTPLGEEISKELDLDTILVYNWDKIESIVKDEKNPYDIQMEFIARLIASPKKYIDSESFDRIKKNAFYRGLPLIDYMRMLGIIARDKYFSLHNLDLNDITPPEKANS